MDNRDFVTIIDEVGFSGFEASSLTYAMFLFALFFCLPVLPRGEGGGRPRLVLAFFALGLYDFLLPLEGLGIRLSALRGVPGLGAGLAMAAAVLGVWRPRSDDRRGGVAAPILFGVFCLSILVDLLVLLGIIALPFLAPWFGALFLVFVARLRGGRGGLSKGAPGKGRDDESEARLRAMVEHAPYNIWMCDAEGRIILQNAFDIATVGDHVGELYSEWTTPDGELSDFGEMSRRALSGEVVDQTLRYRVGDRPRVHRDIIAPAYSGGRIIGTVGVGIDITEQVLAKDELERTVAERTGELSRSNLELTAALQKLKLVQDELVVSGKYAVLARLAATIAHELNTPFAAIASAGRAVDKFLEVDLPETLDWLAGQDEERRALYRELVSRGKSASRAGRPRSQLERRQVLRACFEEEGRAQAERLAELFVEFDLEDLSVDFPELLGDRECVPLLARAGEEIMARRMMEVVGQATERAAEVVRNFRHNVELQGMNEVRDVDVDRDLESVLTLLEGRMRPGIRIERRFGGARARGSSPDLCQVWINLITNAIQAMNYRGTLGVATREEGGWALVEISDVGPGIPEEIQDRIFEPFFTTKKPGEGMGLGLDFCRRVVAAHGGRIDFERDQGVTTFTVRLPLPADPLSAGPVSG